jgi:hypothetical protein
MLKLKRLVDLTNSVELGERIKFSLYPANNTSELTSVDGGRIGLESVVAAILSGSFQFEFSFLYFEFVLSRVDERTYVLSDHVYLLFTPLPQVFV